MSVVWWILEFCFGVAEGFLMIRFIGGYLPFRGWMACRWRPLAILAALAVAQLYLVFSLQLLWMYTTLLITACLLLAALLIFDERPHITAACVLFFYTLVSVVDYLGSYLLSSLMDGVVYATVFSLTPTRFLVTGLLLAVKAALLAAIGKTPLDKRHVAILGLFSGILLFVVVTIVDAYSSYALSADEAAPFYAAVNLSLAALLLAAGIVCMLLLARQYRQRIAYQRMQYETKMFGDALRQNQEQFARWQQSIHNYQNDLICMEALAGEAAGEDLLAYIRSRRQSVAAAAEHVKTGNPVADAIVNNKLLAAADSGVRMTVSAMLTGIDIAPTQLCAILGNALDNAIEAAKACDGERMVELVIRPVKAYLAVRIRNSAQADPLVEGRLRTSTKAGRGAHGIGVPTIEDTVASLGGTVTYHYEGNVITSSILVPL